MTATRVFVIRPPGYSSFEYVPVDANGQACWPSVLPWNQASPIYRTRSTVAAAARWAFPNLPVVVVE